MGLVLSFASGVAAFLIARIVPFGRGRGWLGELLAALVAGAVFGVIATANDFGGWREADWRAAVFAFFGAFGAAGVFRLVTISRRRTLK